MEKVQHIMEVIPSWLLPLIIIVSVWEGVWKLIAMWKAGRNNHLVWFICIALINTVGILPIVYILMHKKKSTTDKTTV